MFKTIFEKVPLPLMVVDQKGQVLFVNRGLEKLTGYTQPDLSSTNLKHICAPYERDRFIFSNLTQIKETTEIDIDLRKKTGTSFMANISFSPFYYKGVFHLLVVIRDVTTRRVQEGKIRENEERYRKLLAEQNKLEDQLKRSSKLASMGELAAGIAHEINNPLGIILGFSQEILEEISEDAPFFEAIKIIEQETVRCVEVIKNLLDFARLKPPQITDIDLIQLLKHSVTLVAPKIKKNSVLIRKNFPKKLPLIKADPQLIQQVFLNVMINAIQAMPLGGELTVAIGVRENQGHENSPPRVCITISDTGPGIPPENLGRIFDPFFTTKGSKGTGLGLSVCQRIVEDHCGKIEVQSRPNVGATCHIYLPIHSLIIPF